MLSVVIEAGVGILGAPDGGSISVRGVCRRAGLTARYLYESFTDVDDLVGTTYDAVVLDIAESAQIAVAAGGSAPEDQIRSAVGDIVGRIDADRRRGRILFSQAPLGGTLAGKRMDAAMMFAAVTIQTSGTHFEGRRCAGGGPPLRRRARASAQRVDR